MATTKAFELAQLSANVTSTTGLSTLATGIVSSEKIGAGIAVPLGNIHSKSAINHLLILESEDANSDIISIDTGGSTRIRSTSGAFAFWTGGDANTQATNASQILTIADDGIVSVASTASSSGSSTGALMVAGGVGVGENLYVGGVINTSNTTTSTNTSTGALIVGGGAGIGENLNVAGNVVVTGNLTVEGTSVTLNTTDLNVEDKNITLNYHASNDTSASAGGAGITIQDAVDASNDASILWNAAGDRFDFSHAVEILGDLDLAANSTETRSLQIGHNRSGDGISLIDLVGDATYSDYGFRVQRSGGQNGKSSLLHHGTGNLEIRALEAATIRFKTTDADRMQIKAGGDIHFYDSAADVGMVWDASEGSDGSLLIGGHTDLRAGSVAGRNDAQLSLESTNYHNAIFVENQNTANGYHLVLGKTRGTAVNAVTIVQAEDEIGSLTFAAADGTDLRPKVAQISAYVSAGTTPATNAVSGELRFGTTSQAQDTTTHMVLNKDGRLGIGTLLPETMLDVQNSSTALYTSNMSGTDSYIPSSSDMIQVRNTHTGLDDIYAGIWFETGTGATNTTGTDRAGRIALVVDNDSAYSSNFVFQTRSANGQLTEKMRITQGGKVGIGTDDPEQSLHVAGKAIVRDGGYPYLELGISSANYFRAVHDNPNDALVFQKYGLAGNIMTLHGGSGVGVAIGDDTNNKNLNVHGSVTANQYNNDEVRHSIRPTLNLDFANSKELDSRITFYRDSIATYYDSKGTLKYANVNEPRFDHDPATGESKGLLIEEARTNLIASSTNMLSSIWGSSAVQTSIRPNSAISPSGKYDSASVIETTDNNSHRFLTDPPISTLSGTTATYSAFVKPIGPNVRHIFFMTQSGADGFYAHFNMSNGTVHQDITGNGTGTGTDAGILPVGNGWYRIWITGSISSSSIYHQLYFETTTRNGFTAESYTGDGASGFAVWGYQVEAGAFPTSYVPSDTRFTSRASTATYHDETGILRTAPVNGARYGYKYDGRKWVETGLILESAGTNLLQNSQRMSSTGWATTHGFVTPDVATAPDGSMTAEKLVANTTNSIHYVRQYISKSSGAAVAYTLSCYIKSAEKNIAWMSTYSSTNEEYVGKFDLSTGVATTSASGTTVDMHYVGNDWYRCELSCTVSSTPSNASLTVFVGDSSQTSYVTSWAGNNSDGIYVWGAQMEASSGKSATSYIQTYGSTGTRSADVSSSVVYTRVKDVAKINNINYSDWYNTEEGAIYTDFHPIASSDSIVVGVGDGTSRGFRAPWLTGATQMRIGTWSGSAYTALHYYNNIVPTDPHKSALSFSYLDNTFLSSLDGSVTAVTSSWAGVETDATTIWIGSETDTNRPYNGHIRKVSLYNEALSTAELQALTENN